MRICCLENTGADSTLVKQNHGTKAFTVSNKLKPTYSQLG